MSKIAEMTEKDLPKYCSYCGRVLKERRTQRYDPITGETSYWIVSLYCPMYRALFGSFEHDQRTFEMHRR